MTRQRTPTRSQRIAPAAIAAAMVLAGLASTAAQSATVPKVRGTPALAFDRNDPSGALTAYVRFEREVPRTHSGRSLVRISIDVPGQPPALEQAVTAAPRSRACYTVLALDNAPARLRTGMRVKLLIDVGGRRGAFKRYRFTVRARGLNPFPARPTDNPLLKDMGCVKGRR